MGNFRLTDPDADNDVRHIILDFGDTSFPVLEGQSIGIVPPGTDANGKPHVIRLYSVASPRDGEKPKTNNLALTVKREPNGSVLELSLRPEEGRQGAGDGSVRRDLPDAGRSIRQHHHDLHRHRLGAVPRLHRAPPPHHARCAGPHDDLLSARAGRRNCRISGRCRKCRTACLRKHFAYSRVPGEAEDLCAGPHARDRGRSVGVSEARQDAYLYLRPEGHGERRRRSDGRYLPRLRARLGGAARRTCARRAAITSRRIRSLSFGIQSVPAAASRAVSTGETSRPVSRNRFRPNRKSYSLIAMRSKNRSLIRRMMRVVRKSGGGHVPMRKSAGCRQFSCWLRPASLRLQRTPRTGRRDRSPPSCRSAPAAPAILSRAW